MSFEETGFKVIRKVLTDDLCHHLKVEFEMTKDVLMYMFNRSDKTSFGDKQSPNSFSMYSPLCFEALLPRLNPLFNDITNKILFPSASYARIYYKDAILEKHQDRMCCEYSATICIDTEELWDFFIEDLSGKINKIVLSPGDLCLYKGCDLKHWREPYKGDKQIQCFLHYVDSEGPNKNWINDQRPLLGLSKNQIFMQMFQLLYQDFDIPSILNIGQDTN